MNLVSNKKFPFSDCDALTDISGGSGAKTYLVEDFSGNTFVRKWGVGQIANKLEAQARWIVENSNEFLCPEIIRDCRKEDLFYYDMVYISHSKTMASTLLTEDPISQKKFLLDVLNRIYEKSKSSLGPPDPHQRKVYLQEKFYHNLELLFAQEAVIAQLNESKVISIQGKKLKSISALQESPGLKKAIQLFLEEPLSSFGHGDLTLSNILYSQHKIYLIDPNPNFTSISPAQEFSKVLQSTMIKYEHLNQITDAYLVENKIDYPDLSAQRLQLVNEQLLGQAPFQHMSHELVLFHLCIHLCRLLPYIPANETGRRVVYFAEIIKLLNRIDGYA